MKGLKIAALVVGGFAVLVAIGLILALTPAVQTWAVHRAVAGQTGMKLTVARVDAGLSAANVTDLHFSQDGVIVTAKGVSARYSAWDYLANRRINADDVSIQDLVVDLRQATTATATGAAAAPSGGRPATSGAPSSAGGATTGTAKPVPFDGLLKQIELMLDVRVGTLAAKGRALLPDDQTVVFDLKGASIAAGENGKLEWTVDFADSKVGAALKALRTTGTLSVRIAKDRRIDLVEVNGTAAALGPNIPAEQFRLAARVEQPAAGGNETYSASLGIVRGGTVEPLVKSSAQWTAAAREIAGTWELAVRTEQLAALLTGLGLPDVAASGNGRFQFKPDTRASRASGELLARATKLEKLSPALEAIGAVELKTAFDGGVTDNLAQLEKLQLVVTGADGRKLAEVSSLQRVTFGLNDQRVTLADPKADLARISVQSLPLAWAQSFAKPMIIESGDLSLAFAVEAEPDGSRVRVRAVEPLALRSVTIRDAQKKALVEQVTLTVRPAIDYSAARISAQLADLSITLPAGDALTGTLSAEVTNAAKTPAVAFNARLQGRIVAALKPYLPVDVGTLTTEVTVEGRHEGQILQLAKASATVNREGAGLLAALEVQQPVRADLSASTFTVPQPDATVARVRLGEIPLAWAEPFVAKSKLAGVFAGATLDVALRSAEDVTLTTTEPITLRGVTATIDGQMLAQTLDLSANFTATKRGENVTYDVRRVEVKQGETSLATLSVAGSAGLGKSLKVAAKGNLEADVAAVLRQPALAGFATLSRGRIATSFEATVADATQASAVISAKNLVAKADNRTLGDLDLTVTASIKPDGSGSFSLPLTLTNAARKSDVKVDGTFGKSTNQKTFLFTGKIASNQLVVDDFEPLAALAPAAEKPAPAKPAAPAAPRPSASATPPPARDTAAFWAAVNGKLELDLKRVLYGKDYVISGVRGTAVITDSKLSLDGLEGKFKDNPFKLAGGLTFAAQQPKPYALTGAVDVQNLDIGEILRAANPGEQPALETKATLTARLNGSGVNVGDLAKNAFGKFELSGTKGVMRYLARKGNAGTVVNLASFGLAVLGASKGSDTTMAIAELSRALNEVQFDSVRLQVERGADLSFKLTSMEILSPILRMTGTGSVAAQKAEDVQNAPMNVVLQLAAKGELGYLLQRVGMLGANKDEKGYQLMSRTFTIGGTPSKPDNSALWKILLEAGLGAFGR